MGYGKSGSQVALRWLVQQAISTDYIAGVIPKSNNPKHLASNIDLFDFELSDEDMKALSAATEPAAEGGDCDVTLSVVPVQATIPTVSLGVNVHGKDVLKPVVGAGTWQYNDTVAYSSVCQAFAAGYTFVDTANGYGNQRGVGKAIKDRWKG